MPLPRDTFHDIPIEWPNLTEITVDLSKWNSTSVANIFEAFATCTLLLNDEDATKTLRSIIWAIIMAAPRARKAMAKRCKTRLKEADTSPTLTEEGESEPTNRGDVASTQTEEREEEGSSDSKAESTTRGRDAGEAPAPSTGYPVKSRPRAPPEVRAISAKKPPHTSDGTQGAQGRDDPLPEPSTHDKDTQGGERTNQENRRERASNLRSDY